MIDLSMMVNVDFYESYDRVHVFEYVDGIWNYRHYGILIDSNTDRYALAENNNIKLHF